MPIYFEQYVTATIEIDKSTPGGDTFTIDGNPYCYAYISAHSRAVRALTNGRSLDYMDIKDNIVDKLQDSNIILVDERHCRDDYGWLGARVYDPETGKEIGAVGARCTRLPGMNTEHEGFGRCATHGGAQAAKSAISNRKMNQVSRQATYFRKLMDKSMERYIKDPAPLSLSRELAQQRAIQETLLEMVTQLGDRDVLLQYLPKLQKNSEIIARTVSKIVQNESKNSITASQVVYLQMTLTECINLFIQDPDTKERAARWLADRLGTSKLLEESMNPRDYILAIR